MNPSNRTSLPAVPTPPPQARREPVLLRLAFWVAISLVVIVLGACAALSGTTKARHLEIAPDPAVRPLHAPVGPELPAPELVCAREQP